MKSFKTKILTPDGPVFDGAAEGVQVPGELGRFEVLSNHAPVLSSLGVGVIRVKTGKETRQFAVSGGVAEVKANVMVILATAAESEDTIDLNRAEKAKQRAEERLRERSKFDAVRAEAALMRAINRIELARRRHG
jgi:F-type H+-transporting ATPase subunit epsilon